MNARRAGLPGKTLATVARIHGHLAAQDAAQKARVDAGADAEALLAGCHAACLAAGVAYVHKLPTPYRVVAAVGARRTIVYCARTATDFAGVMLDGSRNAHGAPRRVAVECKSDADAAGPVYLREVRPHQRAALDAALAADDVAVLAVVLGRGPARALYAVPWDEARGRVALREPELRVHRVRPATPYLGRFVRIEGA